MRVARYLVERRLLDIGQYTAQSTRNPNIFLTIARSMIAIAQISLLALASADQYFVPVGQNSADAKCSGDVSGFSLFCTIDIDRQVTAYGILVLLVVIASGFKPRLLSWVHLYVSFSISTAIALPDGGDQAVMCIAFWLAFASLNDPRTWGWDKRAVPNTKSTVQSYFDSISVAAIFALRLQMAYIYLNSAIAKFPVDAWQDGTAMYYVARMENFGSVTVLGDFLRSLTSVPILTASVTWGTMLCEIALALGLIIGGRFLYVSVLISITLHLAIAVFLGLVSFAVIMVGGVLAAGSLQLQRLRSDILIYKTLTRHPAQQGDLLFRNAGE